MRLLNRFCLNLSGIDYLYRSEETNIFRNDIPDVANAINKLKELSLGETLSRLKEAFPEANENYDIIVGKPKIAIFEEFLKKSQKNLDSFIISKIMKKIIFLVLQIITKILWSFLILQTMTYLKKY